MVKAMDEKRLREIYGPAKEKAAAKILEKLDKHCVNFIENSSFVIIGTLNNQSIDLSPKGDPYGFVKVMSDDLLEIPDRPGNNRIDGLLNIVRNNFISLLFLIHSVNETLRVQGEASISEDMDTRERHRLKTNVHKTVLHLLMKPVLHEVYPCQVYLPNMELELCEQIQLRGLRLFHTLDKNILIQNQTHRQQKK